MKQKMWCLMNAKKDRIIKISDSDGCYTVGYDTKKDLLKAIKELIELDEEIRKIEFEI